MHECEASHLDAEHEGGDADLQTGVGEVFGGFKDVLGDEDADGEDLPEGEEDDEFDGEDFEEGFVWSKVAS